MKIKRNIKTNMSKSFENYKYPFYDDVPMGCYASHIMYAKISKTSKGKEAVEVYYKLEPVNQCYHRINGTLPTCYEKKYYYVKQSYPIDTYFYKAFEFAMSKALGFRIDVKSSLKDIVGVEECVNLFYQTNHSIGGFSERSFVGCNVLFDDKGEEI